MELIWHNVEDLLPEPEYCKTYLVYGYEDIGRACPAGSAKTSMFCKGDKKFKKMPGFSSLCEVRYWADIPPPTSEAY